MHTETSEARSSAQFAAAQDDVLARQIERLIARGEADTARQLCVERLRADPLDAEAQRHLALLHQAMGEPLAAQRAAELACKLAPADPRCWSDLGRVLALQGRFVHAARSFRNAVHVDPLDVENFGKIPGGTIKRQFALHSTYEMQSGPLRGFGFGATLLSVGDRIVLSGDNLTVKGYERLDLHVSYRAQADWNLSLLVRNVTDETYVERPNSAYLYGHFYGAPRSVLFRAEYAFKP